jgi:hypothetical protein
MKKIIFFLVLSILLNISWAIAKTPVTEEQGKATTPKLSATMENIAKHLELLGYRIENDNLVTTTGKAYFIAYSDYENNIIVTEYLPKFIIFRTYLITEIPLSADMKYFANKANLFFETAKMICDTDDKTKNAEITFQAMYTGEYSKDIFGTFLNMYRHDISSINAMENYSKVFLNK